MRKSFRRLVNAEVNRSRAPKNIGLDHLMSMFMVRSQGARRVPAVSILTLAGFENRCGLISDCAILLRLAGTGVNNGGMVTPQEMRLFSLDCLRWSEETNNPSHRDLMLQIAKTWMTTVSQHRAARQRWRRAGAS